MQTSNDYGPEGGQKSFSTLQDRTKSETRCIRFLVLFVVLPLGLVIFAWQAGVCAARRPPDLIRHTCPQRKRTECRALLFLCDGPKEVTRLLNFGLVKLQLDPLVF